MTSFRDLSTRASTHAWKFDSSSTSKVLRVLTERKSSRRENGENRLGSRRRLLHELYWKEKQFSHALHTKRIRRMDIFRRSPEYDGLYQSIRALIACRFVWIFTRGRLQKEGSSQRRIARRHRKVILKKINSARKVCAWSQSRIVITGKQ